MMSEMERIRTLGRNGYDPGQPASELTEAATWVPATDIVARGDDILISTDLPGVPAADIDINVSDGVLTISGGRRDKHGAAAGDEPVTSYLRERYHGPFRRSLVLPDGVDARTISAQFDNGVITVTVPEAANAAPAQSHHIAIVES